MKWTGWKAHLHTEIEFAQGLVDHIMNHTPKLLHRPLSDLIFGEIVDIVITERWVSGDLGGMIETIGQVRLQGLMEEEAGD